MTSLPVPVDEVVPTHWTPEPVRAWRYWKVSDKFWNFGTHRWEVTLNGDIESWDSPLKLAGYHVEQGHRAPQLGCLCGVNAVKELDFDSLKARTTPPDTSWTGMVTFSISMFPTPTPQPFALGTMPVAIGQVLLTGRVDEYELGYRAEQAQIENLILLGGDPHIRDIVADVYGVPVTWEPLRGPTVQKLIAQKQEADKKKEQTNEHGQADQKNRLGAGATTSAWHTFVGAINDASRAIEDTGESRFQRVRGWFADHWPRIVIPAYGFAMYWFGHWTAL